MGTGNSKENWRQSSFRSASASSASPSSSSWASQQSYPQYGAESYNYPPPPSYAQPPEYTQPPPPLYSTQPYSAPSYSAPPSQSYGSDNKKRLERKYSKISDDYSSLEQVSWVSCWFLVESSVCSLMITKLENCRFSWVWVVFDWKVSHYVLFSF